MFPSCIWRRTGPRIWHSAMCCFSALCALNQYHQDLQLRFGLEKLQKHSQITLFGRRENGRKFPCSWKFEESQESSPSFSSSKLSSQVSDSENAIWAYVQILCNACYKCSSFSEVISCKFIAMVNLKSALGSTEMRKENWQGNMKNHLLHELVIHDHLLINDLDCDVLSRLCVYSHLDLGKGALADSSTEPVLPNVGCTTHLSRSEVHRFSFSRLWNSRGLLLKGYMLVSSM